MINLKQKENLFSKIFLALILIFSVLRLYLGSNIPVWFYSNWMHDDLLMLNYSDIVGHFASWNLFSLVKTMSYPLFLSFVNFTGISYSFWLSLLWVIAGILVIIGVYKYITKNKIILLLAFIFVIFHPIAFDIETGLRVYRNAIIAPFTIITFSSLFIFINEAVDDIDKNAIFWAIFSGLAFLFTYYIKEDGIINLPILIVVIMVIVAYNLFKQYKKGNSKQLTKMVIVCIIPLLIFTAGTCVYKEVNNHYFGISEIETRNSGEVGQFYQLLLKIDDPNKSESIWVPLSTLEMAWNASPTLQSTPQLFVELAHTGWAQGDLNANPLTGDMIGWALRDAVNTVGLYPNEQVANNYFATVNNELEKAFENGSLKKSDKIFIASSLAGKDMSEIRNMDKFIEYGLKNDLFYEGIYITEDVFENTSMTMDDAGTRLGSVVLNIDDFSRSSYTSSNLNAIKFADADIKVYNTMSVLVVLLTMIGFISILICEIKTRFGDKYLNLLFIFEIMLIGTFIVQLFAIAWFSTGVSFILEHSMKYYTVGCHGLLILFEVLAISKGFEILKKWRKSP